MFEIKRTIGSSHLGNGKTVSLRTIVDFMQDCSGFQLDNDTALMKYFNANGVTMYLMSRQMDIRKRPSYGDDIFIKTFIYELKTTYGYRNTLIYNDQRELLISSDAVGAFIDASAGRITKIPQDVQDAIKVEPKFADMEYLPRKIKLPEQEGTVCSEIPVYKYFIDENSHVNNARYYDIAEECLPEGFETRTSRIEYRTAAKAGEIIIPIRYDISSDKILLSLTGTEGQIYANTEFIR